MVELKNPPYRTESHRLAFEQAVELLQTGLDRFEVSKQLNQEIPRETRRKITAKAARLLGQYAKSPSGTKPNFSMVLSDSELAWINQNYDGQKAKAVHDALKMLMKS